MKGKQSCCAPNQTNTRETEDIRGSLNSGTLQRTIGATDLNWRKKSFTCELSQLASLRFSHIGNLTNLSFLRYKCKEPEDQTLYSNHSPFQTKPLLWWLKQSHIQVMRKWLLNCLPHLISISSLDASGYMGATPQ